MAKNKGGRPRSLAKKVRIVAYVTPETAERLRRASSRDGLTIGQLAARVIEGASSSLVPITPVTPTQ